MVILKLHWEAWGSSRDVMGTSGNVSCASGKSFLLSICNGQLGIPLELL